MHIVENRIWGLHWLNTYWPLFFLLFFATALSRLRLHTIFAGILTCLIVTASIHNFIYVNNAFKMFFYYRAVNFDDVIANRVNRFDTPVTDRAELYQRTRAIWARHIQEQTMTSIPVELYYLMHDLRLMEPGASYAQRWSVFDGHVRRFDIEKSPAGFFRVAPSAE